jgi:hypothetical protein
MDGLEAGPEDHQKNRAPARIAVFRVRSEDRTEDLVLARVRGSAIPHEGDDVRPRAETAEEEICPLHVLKKHLVGTAMEGDVRFFVGDGRLPRLV